jgi:hypothetical protein
VAWLRRSSSVLIRFQRPGAFLVRSPLCEQQSFTLLGEGRVDAVYSETGVVGCHGLPLRQGKAHRTGRSTVGLEA